MRLTSLVKELEAILQKLIKYEPGLVQVDKHDKHLNDVDGDADEPRSGDVGRGLGAATETETKMVLTRTRTERKKAVLFSVWLKNVIIRNMI
jgi:hypothetical protein